MKGKEGENKEREERKGCLLLFVFSGGQGRIPAMRALAAFTLGRNLGIWA
jgi:hypothetical protein